jgi:hypothetical protein
MNERIKELSKQAWAWAKQQEYKDPAQEFSDILEQKFAELARADEAEKHKWDIHSCGPTCEKKGCVAVREAVAHERDECAKVCENLLAPERRCLDNKVFWKLVTLDCADAIRARSNT